MRFGPLTIESWEGVSKKYLTNLRVTLLVKPTGKRLMREPCPQLLAVKENGERI